MEVLGEPFTCFDAKNYGALMIVDPEDEFHEEEEAKLYQDVVDEGLSLLVFADWYDEGVMDQLHFFDENTRQWWEPVTGGANLPALNTLLHQFGISFGGRVFDGNIGLGKEYAHYASGTAISRFPGGGEDEAYIYGFELTDQSAEYISQQKKRASVAILGLVELGRAKGKIGVFGDSSCLDSAHQNLPCYWLADDLLGWVGGEGLPESYEQKALSRPYVSSSLPIPKYPGNNLWGGYSKVVGVEPFCTEKSYMIWRNGSGVVGGGKGGKGEGGKGVVSLPSSYSSSIVSVVEGPRVEVKFPKLAISKGPYDGEEEFSRGYGRGGEGGEQPESSDQPLLALLWVGIWFGMCLVMLFFVVLVKKGGGRG